MEIIINNKCILDTWHMDWLYCCHVRVFVRANHLYNVLSTSSWCVRNTKQILAIKQFPVRQLIIIIISLEWFCVACNGTMAHGLKWITVSKWKRQTNKNLMLMYYLSQWEESSFPYELESLIWRRRKKIIFERYWTNNLLIDKYIMYYVV